MIMISSSFSVTATRSKILVSAPMNRTIYIHVLSNGTVYLGNSTVTTANGMLTEKNAVPIELFIPANEELWGVSGDGTEDLRLLRPTADGN